MMFVVSKALVKNQCADLPKTEQNRPNSVIHVTVVDITIYNVITFLTHNSCVLYHTRYGREICRSAPWQIAINVTVILRMNVTIINKRRRCENVTIINKNVTIIHQKRYDYHGQKNQSSISKHISIMKHQSHCCLNH